MKEEIMRNSLVARTSSPRDHVRYLHPAVEIFSLQVALVQAVEATVESQVFWKHCWRRLLTERLQGIWV
jgi:hypothetical protein